VPDVCFAYRREHPGAKTVTVVLNFSDSAIAVAGPGAGTIVVSTGMDRVGEQMLGPLRLGPDEGVVIEAD